MWADLDCNVPSAKCLETVPPGTVISRIYVLHFIPKATMANLFGLIQLIITDFLKFVAIDYDHGTGCQYISMESL